MDQKVEVTIVANFVAEVVREPLAYWLSELAVTSTVRFTPPDQMIQCLIDPLNISNEMSNFVLLLIQIERWVHFSGNCQQTTFQNFKDLVNAIEIAAARSQAKAFVVLVCPPSQRALGDETVTRVELSLKEELRAISGIEFVPSDELKRMYPAEDYSSWFDSYSDHQAQIPYSRLGFSAIGTILARKLYKYFRKPRKVIAVDCDNTLWSGVCGEVGPTGVVIGDPQRSIQNFLIEQAKNGRVLCLCSKNNPEDVLNVLDHHPDMILKREFVAAWMINWKPKAENLRALASYLDVSLESFIFIDDEPFECGAVRSLCPEVLVVQLPVDCSDPVNLLQSIWDFDLSDVTEEDQSRTLYYRQNARRLQAKSEALTLSTFIASLELKVEISKLCGEDIERASQLTERVNQFNLNGLRRTAMEISTFLAHGEYYAVRASDRFGQYGHIGLIGIRFGDAVMLVHTLLLSCRALGKGVESYISNFLKKSARKAGLGKIKFEYRATAKNAPISMFLAELGVGHDEGGWTLEL